ncbi:MAG: immunity 22 family protein [Chloroflexota bacterium]
MSITTKAHVWVGKFPSENALHQYFEEQYDMQAGPINRFAADQQIHWYDHDWAERIFHKNLSPLEAVLYHGYFDDVRDAIRTSIEAKEISDINATVMLLEEELETGLDAAGEAYQLIYLGKFKALV